MAWGVTDTGILIPTFAEIREEIAARFREEFGESINTNPDSVFGGLIDIQAEREKEIWDQIEATYNSAYDTATGPALDAVLALTGVQRLEEEKSTAVFQLSGTPGTFVPAGRRFKVDSTGVFWVTAADATIGGGGTVSVAGEAEEFGEINALTSDTYTIETPIFGWSSITCTEDATLGRLEETDSEARDRKRSLLRALGSGTEGALEARLSEVTGVTSVAVINNETDSTVDGIPPHAFKAVVLGGDNTDIAEKILAHKPIGIATAGAITVTVEDEEGNEHDISFSRPTAIPIYVDIVGTKDASYPADGDTQVENETLEYGETLSGGGDVIYLAILSRIFAAVPGIVTLTVEIGTSPGPGGTTASNITIDEDEIATFTAANINVTIT